MSYRGQTGSKKYSETIDLDFGLYWNRMSVSVGTVHDLHKELKGIREEIKKWPARNS